MKRGKDDEKYTGPMFPRLNINDKEKGGPRAPPRNKMALYEQLSIPSQRFNNTPSSFVPPAPSNQGSGQDRGLFFPLHLPKSTPLAENSYAGSNRNPPSAQLATKDKEDEEDFTVPIFLQPDVGPSVNFQTSGDKNRKLPVKTGSFSRQGSERQNKENLKECVPVGKLFTTSVKKSLAREENEAPQKHAEPSAEHESRDSSLSNRIRGNGDLNDPMSSIHNRYSSIVTKDSCPEELRSPGTPTGNIGRHNEETLGLIQTGNGDRGDDASETSMLDSISALDISPDDVVGIIGQKQFWNARKAIVHQQRAFAVQVFELHRLVKVQRSIAGEPHLMAEDNAYLAGPLKVSATKKLPLEYIVKPPSHIVNQKANFEEANNKLEQSAENADAETYPPSARNTTPPSSNRRVSRTPSPVPEFNNGFQQAPGHQWLIPVMSPSEGLIYKPYPGHGFPGPFFGGGGPHGPNPVMGNFVNPAYSFMASQHHNQGNGFSGDPHQNGHGYFSPYGMPVMNPPASSFPTHGQAGWFSGSQGPQPGPFLGPFHGQTGQVTGPEPSSGSVPTSKNGAIPDVPKVRTAYKENELQGSTASSPGGEAHRPREPRSSGRTNALNLFPTSVAERVQEDQTRVIKVVPHNALSAMESAARIFQAIQEGRKHHD